MLFSVVQGVIGCPMEIQALFHMALRCACVLLNHDEEGEKLRDRLKLRLQGLENHLRSNYWLDFTKLNDIHRYKTEQYSETAKNQFNIFPQSIPEWVYGFMPSQGGYFAGNVGPSQMDFRWFSLGNCAAILSSLARKEKEAQGIMDLISKRWRKVVGNMPLKVCYPALEDAEWRIVTGCDSKNIKWSYHNGGSWPGKCKLYSI